MSSIASWKRPRRATTRRRAQRRRRCTLKTCHIAQRSPPNSSPPGQFPADFSHSRYLTGSSAPDYSTCTHHLQGRKRLHPDTRAARRHGRALARALKSVLPLSSTLGVCHLAVLWLRLPITAQVRPSPVARASSC